jgi:hypothetical protein
MYAFVLLRSWFWCKAGSWTMTRTTMTWWMRLLPSAPPNTWQN